MKKIKPMTLEQFLDILVKHKAKWFTWGLYQAILTVIDNHQFSPLTFVCRMKTGKIFKLWQYQKAAKALNLPEILMKEIEDSSDPAVLIRFSGETRRKLLQITKPSKKIPKSILKVMEEVEL